MSISTTQNITALGDLKHKIASAFTATTESLSTFTRKRRVYNATFTELAGLTTRELADLGFCRGDIRRIAREAAELA